MSLDGLGLSTFDYALAGLLPMAALALLLFLVHIVIVRLKTDTDRRLAFVPRVFPFLGPVVIMAAYVLPKPYISLAFSVFASLVLIALWGAHFMSRPLADRRQLVAAVAAIGVSCVSIATTFGESAVLRTYTSAPLAVRTSDATLQTKLDAADLRLIVHAGSVWHFADKATVPTGFTLEAKPVVYSLPDSIVTSVVAQPR
jgi:hypothetical protein